MTRTEDQGVPQTVAAHMTAETTESNVLSCMAILKVNTFAGYGFVSVRYSSETSFVINSCMQKVGLRKISNNVFIVVSPDPQLVAQAL